MELKQIKYRGVVITVKYNKSQDGFYACSIAGNSYNEFKEESANYGGEYETIREAINDVKAQIDAFIGSNPTTYKELAATLADNLTWTGYEDCYLDVQVCEIIVGNFIKHQQGKLKQSQDE